MRLELKIIGASFAVLLSVLAAQPGRGDAARAASVAGETGVIAGTGYASLLHGLDERIESLYARAADRPDDWLVRMHLGTALLERASLTLAADDYASLQHVLDEAFAIAPEGSGPMLLAARFNFAIHRLDVALDYLDRIDRRPLRKYDELLATRLLRAQIALQRGEYEAAFAGLSEIAAAVPVAGNAELALYHARTGAQDEADALLVDALARTSPRDTRRRAWTMLQRGLVAMDRGAYLQALERLREADAELSGWWLVQEHIAEVHDRLGEHGRAIEIYEQLVRTHGMPQHMDALAIARRHAGQDAAEPIERAGAIWADLFERLPEATMGHGLEHELLFGDPTRAVALAETNHAARPNGDAKVMLARAYLGAGRPGDALEVVRAALATPYRTAALHRVAADAHEALGETSAAADQRARCVAINPSCDAATHSH